MSAIKGAKMVGFPIGATAALVTWALSRKPGDAHTAQKAGLRARGDRHRQVAAPMVLVIRELGVSARHKQRHCQNTTHEQCQWTASGIGGCALNPRLLFPNTPGHPEAKP